MADLVDDEYLVGNLNTLLTNLQIPITLETPLDLTPFLILALFESTLRTRLPLPQATRQAKSHKDKVEAMKIVLGVLEDDVLGIDIGLGNVDPRKLAKGEPDEVRYIGEVLCWLGRKTGYLGVHSQEDEKPRIDTRSETGESSSRKSRWSKARRATEGEQAEEDVFGPIRKSNMLSPSIASTSVESSLLHLSEPDDSHTAMSLHDAIDEGEDVHANEGPLLSSSALHLDDLSNFQPRRDTFSSRSRQLPSPDHRDPPLQPDATIDLDEVAAFLDSRADRSREPPLPPLSTSKGAHESPRRRIRVPSRRYDDDSESELEESIEESFCRCTPKATPPVRRTGYIHTVDLDEELRSFEATRRKQKTPIPNHLSRSLGARPRYPGLDLRTPSRLPTDSSSPTILTRHTSPSQHTLALLEERVRLLEELARLKIEQT